MYVKLFGTILNSSIWGADASTRIVWVTMLVMADREGVVIASHSGLARAAALPEPEVRRALAQLEAPDEDSKSQEEDGARVVRVAGGWHLVNYEKYREIRTEEQLRAAFRQQRHREQVRDRSQDAVTGSVSASVSVVKDVVQEKRDSESGEVLPAKIEEPNVVQLRTRERKTKEAALKLAAEVVFRYWRDRMGWEPTRTLLTDDRERKVIKALRENGADVSELLYAIDGALRDDWTMGRAPNSTKKYDDLESLLLNRNRIEKFLRLVPERWAQHPFLDEVKCG